MQHAIRSFDQATRPKPLVLEVREAREQMILRGDIAPGERLDEPALAAQFGVSRSPVREAARSLEREGLVTTVANRGVFVRSLSPADAAELYDLRALLAGHLCGRLARRADAAMRGELHRFVERMDEAIAADDEPGYFTLNLAFHDRIAALAGASRACALYAARGKEVRLMRRRVLSGAASLRQSNAEHRRIVAAIEAGDATAARHAGAHHHETGKQRLLETFDDDGR